MNIYSVNKILVPNYFKHNEYVRKIQIIQWLAFLVEI